MRWTVPVVYDAFVLALLLSLSSSALAQSSGLLPSNAPNQTQPGQAGFNQCGTTSSQTSQCQNAFINNLTDWCLWCPPDPGPGSVIGNTERFEVAWCLKNGYGTRLIPDGTITGAHLVVTPDFIQVTGVGDLTRLNVPAGDGGGELDPHGADGNGNPVGGLVFSSAFGQLEQIFEWTNFISDTQFCFRACKPGPMAVAWCEHIYDIMGCEWNMPANYNPGVFEQCLGDSGLPMGVYGTSTFSQGDPVTPPAHPVPSSSSCTTISTIGNGFVITGSSILPASPTPTGSSASGSVAATGVSASSSVSGSGTPNSSATSSRASGDTLSRTTTSGTATGTNNAGISKTATVSGGDWIFFTASTAFVGSLIGAILVL